MPAPSIEVPAAPPVPAPDAAPAANDSTSRWFWPGFVAALLVSAALQLIRLDRQGLGNPYYAAAVRSMLENFHAFFFASFDAAGWVTVDKPPLGLWAQTLGARLLGFGPWGLLLPQALATIASVALVALLVRRAFGPAAGLLAGLALALTPVAVAVGRTNEVDATLTLLVLLGAWALLHGIDNGQGRWALLAATCIGLAFNVKMLEAYLVVPAFALAWLCCARAPLRARLAQLAGSAVVLLVVSFAWATVVELTPPDRRPYIGSSARNSIFELIVGYNGLDRLLPPGWTLGGLLPGANGADRPNPAMVLAAFGAIETGPRGPQRLFNPLLGGQTSWLLPLALLGLVLATAQARRITLPAVQRRQFAALWLWGGWLATGFAFFSVANQFHRYYLVVLAPPVAALAGIGLAALWRDYRRPGWRGWLLPLAVAGTAALALWLLVPFPTYARWLGPPVALLALIGIVLLVIARTRSPAMPIAFRASRWLGVGVAASLAAILLGPAVWSAHALWQPVNNILPAAGPDVGFALPGGRPGAPPPGARSANGMDGFGQPGDMDRADPALIAFLTAHRGGERFPLATTNALTAAPVIIATGWPVAALGGFIGQDPIATNDQLAALAQRGEMRYFLVPDVARLESLAARLNGETPRATSNPPAASASATPNAEQSAQGDSQSGSAGTGRSQLASFVNFLISDNARWVSAHCAPVPSAEWRSPAQTADPFSALSTLYDCRPERLP